MNLLVPGVRGQQKGRRNRPGNHHPGGQPHPRPFLWHEEQAARGALIELMTRIERTHRRAA